MSLGLFDRRDVEFLVREVIGAERLFQLDAFSGQSWDDFEMILDAAWKLAHDVLAPTNIAGDREGLKFVDGEVKTPAVFKSAYKAFTDGGWLGLTEKAEHGGIGMPRALGIHPTTGILSANVAFYLLPGLGHGASELVWAFGTDRQKKVFGERLTSGEWGGTMCLTEPNAGSDVGNARAVAIPQPDGTFHIKGTKIFITWGEHDITPNIVYPVLARIEGDPPGTGGLSLFLVSKFHTDDKGNLGARNGVKCAGIEHKMGLHGSPTATMVFGEDDTPCVGELLGEPRRGMREMFQMMNTARIAVGMQALGVSEAAYRYAHQYALERQQGTAVEQFKDPNAPRVSIIRHPDVRRMLLDMRSTVEGLRALLGFAALQADLEWAAEGAEAEQAGELLALLTPLCKGYASEIGFEAISTSIMILGGHGYLRDHPLEQHLRDTVIARLYEGTTGIQAIDLVSRKLGHKGGQPLMALMARVEATIKEAREAGLNDLADKVGAMAKKVGMAAMALGGRFMGGDLYGPLLQATPMMYLFGDAVTSWLHLWMATVAAKAENKTDFHENKVVTARHFIHNAAPRVDARYAQIEGDDRSPLQVKFEGEEELPN
jgi:alkylation response protein AidB-like acyl-CoA dehydrogenase